MKIQGRIIAAAATATAKELQPSVHYGFIRKITNKHEKFN